MYDGRQQWRHSERIWYMMKAMDDGRQQWRHSERAMAWEEEETETLWEKRVKSVVFECVGAWELVLCVALCCLGVCVCVYVPSHLKHSRQGSLCLSWDQETVCVCMHISAQAFETGVFMFELRSRTVCVWLCAVWCVCACSISAQTFETGVFMFELSWSKAWLCGSLSQSLLIWEREWLVVVYCEVQVWPYSYF